MEGLNKFKLAVKYQTTILVDVDAITADGAVDRFFNTREGFGVFDVLKESVDYADVSDFEVVGVEEIKQ